MAFAERWDNSKWPASDEGSRYRTMVDADLDLPAETLVDPENFDFRLKPDSPAINAGKTTPGITGKFTGSAPDLGAIEDGTPAWKAGYQKP